MSADAWKSFGRGQALMNVKEQSTCPGNNSMNMPNYTNEKIVDFLDSISPQADQGVGEANAASSRTSVTMENDGLEKYQPTGDKAQSQEGEPKTKSTLGASRTWNNSGNPSGFPSKRQQQQAVVDKPESFTFVSEDFPPL